MKNSILSSGIIILVVLFSCVAFVAAQDKLEAKEKFKEKSKAFCGESWNNGDRVSFRDLREMTVPANGTLDVDAGRNGGISVKGENRSDVVVRACVQAWGATDEAAKDIAANVKITTAGGIRADGPDESNYSVSFQILVPRSTDVRLKAHNGGISIASVDGTLEFETTNGGVSLSEVSGNVRGRTTNGGVNVSLSGNSWKGNGLEVQTSNGGVHLSIPENYAANVEAGTVNGGFSSDIAALNVTTEDIKGGWDHRTPRIVKTAINGGGAPIKVTTTNGGIRIESSNSVRY